MRTINRSPLVTIYIIMALTVMLGGCAGADADAAGWDMSLEETAEQLCAGVDLPPYETVMLDSSNFEYYAFMPYDEGLSAAAADALVNITPHSVVLIRTEKDNAKSLAEEVLQNADPGKWLCVRADTVSVAYTDHYVLLVMSEAETAKAITDNFKAMAKELDGTDMTLLTADKAS